MYMEILLLGCTLMSLGVSDRLITLELEAEVAKLKEMNEELRRKQVY